MSDKTASFRVTVARAAGLHARPSLAVAETVRRYQSRVVIRSAKQEADAKKLVKIAIPLLLLAIAAALTIGADGICSWLEPK